MAEEVVFNNQETIEVKSQKPQNKKKKYIIIAIAAVGVLLLIFLISRLNRSYIGSWVADNGSSVSFVISSNHSFTSKAGYKTYSGTWQEVNDNMITAKTSGVMYTIKYDSLTDTISVYLTDGNTDNLLSITCERQ